MPSYHYYQLNGGEESWRPSPVANRQNLEEKDKPTFITVLSVSRLIDESDPSLKMTYEEKLKLAYDGPFYCDWDSEDELLVIEKVNQFLDKLEEMRVDLHQCRLYATGGRGYHLEIPQEIFMEKIPAKGTIGLPGIYREMAYNLAVDTLDLKIYSGGRGRMWRTPNVKRTNNRYKVPVTLEEMRAMTPEKCIEITSNPRAPLPVARPIWTPDLAVEFDKAKQKVDGLLAQRKRYKPDPDTAKRAQSDSVLMAMAGFGVREGTGFQELAMQLACAAATAGISEDTFVERCAGLIENHVSDSRRYNTDSKRSEELRRMFRYMDGNFCYEFSIGAMKSVLSHSAPDLDGIQVSKEDLKEEITRAESEEATEMDEYKDVAKGITLAKFGVYKEIEGVRRRICAIGFDQSVLLKSTEQSTLVGYETTIVVNGQPQGRQMLELEALGSLNTFGRLAAKYGHAFQGTDADVRTMMMRFVEQAKKRGKTMFIAKREGLDMLNIPMHENPLFREDFVLWSDGNGVLLPPTHVEAGLEMSFQGYPDPHGVFKTDLALAPRLPEWLKEPGNRKALRETLEKLMTCQRSDLLGKLLGWHVACFWKQLFQSVYGKFPLLHINGAAGVGKTETTILLSSLFNYRNEPRPTSPSSTTFAMQQQMTSSASIPLIIDEYKPIEMKPEVHNRMKAMFRDAYNQRTVSRGGGTRESDDYRSLHAAELSAPVIFIAEAAEDEAAVMERVVLATFSRPPAIEGLKNLAKFQHVRQNHEHLGILGAYVAGRILKEVSKISFRDEFDALYAEAQAKYMLTEADLSGDLTEEELLNKQNAKERSVFNHTVARFGFRQFRALVNEALDNDLDDLMGELEEGIYTRLADLNAATTPEHIKVLMEIAQMSHVVEDERPEAIREGMEYAFINQGGRALIEIAIGSAYSRYRLYCKSHDMRPFFQTREAFMHSLRDSPTFVKHGIGEELALPHIYTFDITEMSKFGVTLFKAA